MKVKAIFHDGGNPPNSFDSSWRNTRGSPETPNKADNPDPDDSPELSESSPTTTRKPGAGHDGEKDMVDDIPTLIMASPNTYSSAHTEIPGHLNEVKVPFIPPRRPLLIYHRETNHPSISMSSEAATSANDAGATAPSSSTFACLDEFSDDASFRSTSSSSSSASKSGSSVMSSDSSSTDSLISKCSTLSDNIDVCDENEASAESTSIFDSTPPPGTNTSSSGTAMKKASATRLRRGRGITQDKKRPAMKKADRPANKTKLQLRTRDRFLKKMAMRGEADYTYLKENEMRARGVTRKTGTGARSRALGRHILFEVFYSLPAAITMMVFCCTHVAIYEFVQIAVADCLELNEYYNQTLVYICVFAVAVILARISGGLYEFTSEDAYNSIKFDMHNKLKLGDLDARFLRRIKKHPTAKLLLDVTSLYLTYISANHFLTETMLKNLFDKKEVVLEGLPSMKYPGISTHISNFLLHGEKIFEDPSLILGEQTSAKLSTACATLGGDLCDESVFQACSALDEFRANLTAADGEHLYDKVSFNTYYKIIGDTSAGIYDYQSAMAALLVCLFVGTTFLRKSGVGIWDM